MMGLYLEEIEPGLRVDLGTYAFTRDNILKFAIAYDPQPFHTDDEAAARGPFGKLAASGWHTAAGWMKCFVAVNNAHAGRAVLGPSPGFTNLRWLKPVYPGDTISYSTTVTGKRDMASRSGWGLVFARNEGVDQDGILVFSFESKVMTPKRPA